MQIRHEHIATGSRGFTLIELMIVVAIVAIIAAVAIPAWNKQAQSARADSEVNAMFAEISTRQEQYKSENGTYLDVNSACPSTGATPAGASWATCANTGGWKTMHVNPPDSTMYCQYNTRAGVSGTSPSPPGTFTMTAVAGYTGSWYWIEATCDMDNNSSTTNATFFRSSYDLKLQKANYGQ